MFSLKRLEDLADGVAEPLSLLNTRVLEALGRRIALARSGRFDRLSTLTSAEKEANALYTSILRELGKTSASADEVFAEAAKIAYENANRFYAARGIKQLPIKYQTGLINFVLGVAQTTKQTFTNLSNSSAIGFRVLNADGSVRYTGFKEQYLRLVDQAIAEVATGQKDYGSALRHAMKQTADSGIRLVDYQSGYSRRLDSAMRQNILDGVKDIAHEVSMRTGEQFGADGVEIDAHNYCAEDHLPYQGRQFKKTEFEDIQNSLPRQFGQYNCRHTYYSIILGLSEPLYTEDERQAMKEQSTEKIEFEGKEYTRYEATQLQRRIETSVRQSKDRAIIAKASGDDLTRRVEQLRINQLKQKYSEITNVFKTPPALDRMSVSGFRAVKPILPKVLKAPDTILKQNISYIFNDLGGKINKGLIPTNVPITGVKIIAGNGSSNSIRDIDRLVANYGGNARDWQKKVGFVDGNAYNYEIHWYESQGKQYEEKYKSRKKQ